MDVVQPVFRLVRSRRSIGDVDERVVVGARRRGTELGVDDAERGAAHVDAEAFEEELRIDGLRPEHRHLVPGGHQGLDHGTGDLLATADRPPVQVVHGDPA